MATRLSTIFRKAKIVELIPEAWAMSRITVECLCTDAFNNYNT